MSMSSRDVAKKFGVSLTTVYNWCDKGILKPVRRSPTGRRIFDDVEVQKLYDSGTIKKYRCIQ